MGKPVSGARLRLVGQILFVIGGLAVCFRLAIGRQLLEWFGPPVPAYLTSPTQHPLIRYEMGVCLAGLAFILVAGIVAVIAIMRGRE